MSDLKDAKNGDIVQFEYMTNKGGVWEDAFGIHR